MHKPGKAYAPLPTSLFKRNNSMSDNNSTVKFCKKCQTDTERNSRGECRPCMNARSSAWRDANSEKVKQSKAAYREANKEKIKASFLDWASRNAEKIKERMAVYGNENRDKLRANGVAYHAKNAEKVKEKNRAWRIKNPDKVKEQNAKWNDLNPEARRVINHNRRAKVRGAGGKLSIDIVEKLFKLQKGKCPVCKDGLSLTKPRSPLDHIVAISNGGLNNDDNMQMLCRTCNQQKHAKHPVDFMQSKGFLL